MADIISCHKCTISREVRRNRGQRGYRPKQAHESATARHLAAYRPRITPPTWTLVESLLLKEWSPEQIISLNVIENLPLTTLNARRVMPGVSLLLVSNERRSPKAILSWRNERKRACR